MTEQELKAAYDVEAEQWLKTYNELQELEKSKKTLVLQAKAHSQRADALRDMLVYFHSWPITETGAPAPPVVKACEQS